MAWVLVLISFFLLAFLALLLTLGCFSRIEEKYSYRNKPGIICILFKGAIISCKRRQGLLYPVQVGSDQVLTGLSNVGPPVDSGHKARVVITDCRIDYDSLSLYRRVCGYTDWSSIPLCYLESLFMRSLMILAVSSKCRLAPLGLIHIRQTVTVYESLDDLLTSTFDLHTELVRYRKVERGIEADVKLQVFNKADKCVWEGELTVLSRNPRAQRSGAHKSTSEEHIGADYREAEVVVSRDTGINYAKASGDWNPHHLYQWSAQLLGYEKPIAHGMWSLARTLTEVVKPNKKLAFPVHIEASFKRPLFMPSVCLIQHGGEASSFWFRMVDKETKVPQLVGTVASLG